MARGLSASSLMPFPRLPRRHMYADPCLAYNLILWPCFMWARSLSARWNVMSHSMMVHLNLGGPCLSMWRRQSPARTKDLPQPSTEQVMRGAGADAGENLVASGGARSSCGGTVSRVKSNWASGEAGGKTGSLVSRGILPCPSGMSIGKSSPERWFQSG